MVATDLEKIFSNPPMIYRGTELWMLNDRLDDAELRRQVKEMAEKGFYSFIARTYLGLKSDYPGPGFMGKMRTIIDAAREYGMKVFLQAGYMPAAVVGLPAEFSMKKITAFPCTGENLEGEEICRHNGVSYRAVRADMFLDMLNPEAMRFYMKQSYEDMWKEFRDEFGKTIISVWVDEPHFKPDSLPWSSVLQEQFVEKWGYRIEDKVFLLFVDGDGCETVRHHYWRTVMELMKKAYFTEVRDWCHKNNLMFSGHLMAEDTLESQIGETCCTMPFYKYFDIPGIDFLTAEMEWRYNPIPWRYNTRSSLIGRNDRENGMFTTPIQCVSAAHQAGKEHILCEMFGCSTQNLTFRDQKNLFDHFASLGINHKCIHAVFYSLRGRGKRAYPPHINYYQPYWENYKLMNDYIARASWFISQGKPVRDIVVIHPIESAFCEYHGPVGSEANNTVLERRDIAFLELLKNLLACQCDFELGDEDTISEMGHADQEGYFHIGEMRYKAVILPDLITIRPSTLALLEKFALAGGRIFILGRVPGLVDGLRDENISNKILGLPGVVYAETRKELLDCLEKMDKAYKFDCSGNNTAIQLNYRSDDKHHYFFFFNRNCREAVTGELTVEGRLRAFAWDGKDGTVTPMAVTYENNRTSVDIIIEEGGSLMLSMEKADEIRIGKQDRPQSAISLQIEGPWHVSRKDPNVLLLEFCRYRKNERQEWSSLYPVIALQEILTREDYTGPLQLSFPFSSSITLTGLRLALESPGDCSIMLDNVSVSNKPKGFYMAKAFECVDLPMTVQPGRHEIVISRHFTPLAKARSGLTSLFEDLPGVELESMYLLGDFAVIGRTEPTKENTVRLARDFDLCSESGICGSELVTTGYPFYAGTIVLDKAFELPAEVPANRETYLEVNGFRACMARISVNGTNAGTLVWAPYRIDITGLLKPGVNTISIELTNTLRNLLGPYHRPWGEMGTTFFRGYLNHYMPWMGGYNYFNGQLIPDWADNRDVDTPGWTESYMQVSFGINDISLKVY